jgi:hypothetical protein
MYDSGRYTTEEIAATFERNQVSSLTASRSASRDALAGAFLDEVGQEHVGWVSFRVGGLDGGPGALLMRRWSRG